MYQAMLNKDVKTLSKILTPKFHLIHITGLDQTKEQWLNDIQTGQLVYMNTTEHAIKDLKISNISASFIGQNVVEASVKGSHGTWNLEFHMSFIKLNDEWLIDKVVAGIF